MFIKTLIIIIIIYLLYIYVFIPIINPFCSIEEAYRVNNEVQVGDIVIVRYNPSPYGMFTLYTHAEIVISKSDDPTKTKVLGFKGEGYDESSLYKLVRESNSVLVFRPGLSEDYVQQMIEYSRKYKARKFDIFLQKETSRLFCTQFLQLIDVEKKISKEFVRAPKSLIGDHPIIYKTKHTGYLKYFYK